MSSPSKRLLSTDRAALGAAFETYATSIDKIHSMCVVASPGSRIRSPGPQDQPILDGLVNSLGAGLAADPGFDTSLAEKPVSYLLQIADEAGPEAGRYRAAAEDVQNALR